MKNNTKQLIFYGNQYLKQLKFELLCSDTLSNSEYQTDYALLEWKNEKENCYKRINDEYSRINGSQTKKINQFSTPYDTLLAENNELCRALVNTENAKRNLQNELCVLKDEKVSDAIFTL
jgi:hypothetical protein